VSIGLPTYEFYGPATPINRWIKKRSRTTGQKSSVDCRSIAGGEDIRKEAVYLQEWQKLLQILTTHPLHLWVYLIKKIQLKHLFMVWDLWNDIWAWSCFTEILWWTQVSNGCSVCVFQVFWGPSSPSFHHYQVLSLSSLYSVWFTSVSSNLVKPVTSVSSCPQTWLNQ